MNSMATRNRLSRCVCVCRSLISQLKLKTEFLRDLPYAVIWFDDPLVCNQALDTFGTDWQEFPRPASSPVLHMQTQDAARSCPRSSPRWSCQPKDFPHVKQQDVDTHHQENVEADEQVTGHRS